MKRTLLLLAVATLCSACTQLLYTTYTPLNSSVQAIGRGLTPTEDRATGLYGYLNDFGLWAISPQYKSAQRFSDGMARVQVGSRYGTINPLGQWVIQPVFFSAVGAGFGLMWSK
jgi:hypothetical protein